MLLHSHRRKLFVGDKNHLDEQSEKNALRNGEGDREFPMLDFLVVDVIDLTGDVTRNNRVNVTWPADERHRAVHLGWRRGRSHTDRRTVTRIPRHVRVDAA